MLDRVRILPVTMAAAALLFVVKVGDVWRGDDGLAGVAQAGTQQAAGDAKAEPAKSAEPAPTADAGGAHAAEADRDTDADAPVAGTLAAKDPTLFSKSELELLQNLAVRRDELESRARALEMRENLLQATERRIDGKIVELRQIENKIQALLDRYDQREDAQLRSLVKVYENMKPKDAARIFNQLEMDILLNVAERMREAKVAPVLAKMDSAKAKALTVELATRRKLPDFYTAGGRDG